MLVLLTALFAHAAPPTRVVEVFDTEATVIQDLATSDDGSLIAAALADGVFFVDTLTWQTGRWSGCDANGVGLQRLDVSEHVAWVGCEDGTVQRLEVAGAVPVLDSDNDVTLELDSIDAVHWDVNGSRAYVVGESSTLAVGAIHVISSDGSVNPTGFPVALLRTGHLDSVVSGGILYILHSGDDISTYVLGSTASQVNQIFTIYNVSDLAPSIRGSAIGADNSGVIVEYASQYTVLVASVGDEADAVGVSDWSADEWLAVSRGTDIETYSLTNGTPASATTADGSFDAGVQMSDIVVGRQGYGFGVSGGELHVMTANPWVTEVAVSPANAVDGTAVSVSFEIDGDVDWELRLNTETGTVLASGTAEESELIELDLTVDGTYTEGINELIVIATDSAGLVGTRSGQVAVDNPPPAPELTDASIGFGDEELAIDFGEDAVADLARYDVYVSISPFEPSDFETGGPDFNGTDALTTPISISVGDDGTTNGTISPLTNEVTYYIAARAVDASGQESPMSALVSGTPRPTFTASEFSEDPGGAACSHAPVGVLALPLLAVAAVTRRRRWAAVAVASALTTTTALADMPTDETDAHWNTEVRYGSVTLESDSLADFYGTNGHDIIEVEFGPQFYRFAELDLGLGYYRDRNVTLDEDGEPSGEEVRFTMVPITLDLTLRGHILDEQPFVPFVRVGLDYTLWREARVGSSADGAASGSKAGWHWGLGGQLLLDTFARRRASRLEANTGINDTWLTIEYRDVTVNEGQFLFFDNSEGLSFSRTQLMIGLKLDY